MNLALNDYATDKGNVKYQGVKDVIKFIIPQSYCKIYLKMVYLCFGIRPSQYHMLGVKWKFDGDKEATCLVDTRLMMGASKSPSVFHRLSQAVKRFMRKGGYQLVAYLHDYIIVADDYVTCLKGQHTLIRLLRELGFTIYITRSMGPLKTSFPRYRN